MKHLSLLLIFSILVPNAFAATAEEASQELSRAISVQQDLIKTGDPMEKDLEGATQTPKISVDVQLLDEASEVPEPTLEDSQPTKKRTIPA